MNNCYVVYVMDRDGWYTHSVECVKQVAIDTAKQFKAAYVKCGSKVIFDTRA